METILMLFLPLFIETILPQILNKPAEVRKPALLRRIVRFGKLADSIESSPVEQFVFGELADLCGCAADADDEQLGVIRDGLAQTSASLKSTMATMGGF